MMGSYVEKTLSVNLENDATAQIAANVSEKFNEEEISSNSNSNLGVRGSIKQPLQGRMIQRNLTTKNDLPQSDEFVPDQRNMSMRHGMTMTQNNGQQMLDPRANSNINLMAFSESNRLGQAQSDSTKQYEMSPYNSEVFFASNSFAEALRNTQKQDHHSEASSSLNS